MQLEYEFNADFDLSLRPHWSRDEGEGFARRLSEFGYHLLLIGDAQDSVLLDGPVPEDFVGYLGRLGFAIPRATIRPEIRPEARFSPFGWNEAAAELNLRYESPVDHPPIDVVRRVNGREFAAAIERELCGDAVVAHRFDSIHDVVAFVAAEPPRRAGWVIKSNHGNAGLGNRRIESGPLAPGDRGFVGDLLGQGEAVQLEPWLPRVGDLSVSFEIDAAGTLGDPLVHQVVNTSSGAFIGAVYDRRSEMVRAWGGELSRTAAEVGRRLADEGYFGPVCIDGFLWNDAGQIRLRPLVDVNARQEVSRAARRVWDGWGRDRVVYWRFFTRRKLRLPEDYAGLEKALDSDAFDAERKLGAMITSPLWLAGDGGRRSLHKLGVLFAATSTVDAMAREDRFRERFER